MNEKQDYKNENIGRKMLKKYAKKPIFKGKK